jgi:phage/plasmid-associated DNA primase
MKNRHPSGSGQQAKSDLTLPAINRQRLLQFSDEHLAKIAKSALTPDQIAALKGWQSLSNGQLEIAYYRPDGTPELCQNGTAFKRWRQAQHKIDKATAAGRKPAKYLSPKAEGCRLYHSALAISSGRYPERLADQYVPLRFTEGELKTEAAAAHDPNCVTIGLGGVNSWRDHRSGGEVSLPLKELEAIPLAGREVRLCFDSDLHKPQVAAALHGLAEYLANQGARVLIEVLPNGLDGERLGIDDLIYRHGAAVFHEVAAIARSPFKERKGKNESIREWAFNPEPINTRERNAYLFGMLGRYWRSSCNGKDHWQHWTGTHWEEVIGDDPLSRALEQFAALQDWKNRELATLRSLQAAFRRSIELATPGSAPGLLPFRNGCLLLDDMQLVPHDPAHGNRWALPYDYSPAAACPGIEELLLDRLGDVESVALFRAFCRALLTGERLKCFLEITGPSNTGKSVLGNLLKALVGDLNTAAGTLQRLEDRSQPFETSNLAGKRLAIFSECQDYSGQLQTLKALTGGDAIRAEIKFGRQFHFTYGGGVVLVGNGPIRASDPTGAVINRRRSLLVPKVVAARHERCLLVADERGQWSGELAAELPGLANWALEMKPADARAALAQDGRSLARAQAKLEALLSTDLLADWADQHLIWDQDRDLEHSLGVGVADGDPDLFLFPSYLRFMDQQGRNTRPLSMKVFKAKLVDLLRDTLGLGLPAGRLSEGGYKQRGKGSVVPYLRFRQRGEEELPGVIRHAVMTEASGTDAEWEGNGNSPVGNGWNGWNESEPATDKEKDSPVVPSLIGEVNAETVPAVPSVPCKGSQPRAVVPATAPSVPHSRPVEVLNQRTGQWEPGWHQIGKGKGSASVLCRNPRGHSKLIGKKEIRVSQEAA